MTVSISDLADIDSFFDGFDESLRKGVDALQDAGADDDAAKHATRVEFMTRSARSALLC